MSVAAYRRRRPLGAKQAKQIAKAVSRLHLPVGPLSRPVFAAGYRLHVALRVAAAWSARFFWYEPLFRSRCSEVGQGFVMEQLPYLLGRGDIAIGAGVRFSGKPSFAFSARYCAVPRLSIGDGCFLGHNCAITVAREVRIGNYCLIAGGVRISDFDGHSVDAAARRSGAMSPRETGEPVSLGDDVWLGHGAVILKGVRIGDRSVVGARAVVTRDVEPDTVVAGNPARVVKKLSQPRGDR